MDAVAHRLPRCPVLVGEENLLDVSVQSTAVQQSSGSEQQDSDVVAQCESFLASSCPGPNVAKIQRSTKTVSHTSNPNSLCFCGQRNWLQLCYHCWKVETPCVETPIKA